MRNPTVNNPLWMSDTLRPAKRGSGIVSALMVMLTLTLTLALGTAGCAGVDENPSKFSQTVDAFRARFQQSRPEFLRFKSSTDLGYRALALKDYDKAAWHLEFETKNNPDDPAPRLYLGQVYAETGRIEQAQTMYRSAIALGPTATVKRDAAAQGRLIAEIAAERLAALSGPAESESATAASILDAATVSGDMPGDVTPMMALPPDRATARLEYEPETIVISAATLPRTLAAATGPRTPAAAPAPEEIAEPVPTIAIHLASYKRRAKADAGWNILRRQNPELNALNPTVVEADLGPVKGIYFRLVANGIHSAKDARDLCRVLKSRGHDWCQIGTISQ